MADTDETQAAAEAAEADDPSGHARRWLLQTSAATLCTTSTKRTVAGFPFGSVVPFALTGDGRPAILIASIAAHTANLRADSRASLFVRQPGLEGDPQKGWRLTVMGTWEMVPPGAARDELHARYVERVPFADGYLDTHDFDYWQMTEVAAVRYIAGFGKICWLPGDSILRDPGGEGIADSAPGAIAHMNEDHGANMVEMCAGLHGFTPERCEMVALDRTGFLVQAHGPERLAYFPFHREIGASELRHAVVEVLKRARQQI